MLTFRATTLTLTADDGQTVRLGPDPAAEFVVEATPAPLAVPRVIELGSVTFEAARVNVWHRRWRAQRARAAPR